MLKRLLIGSIIISVFISIFVIISVSTNDEPAIVKKESPPLDPNKKPELVEKVNEEKEKDEFIEFALRNEQIMVNLKMTPILKEYLQGADNQQEAIKTMEISSIYDDKGSLYLLEFSCYNELCSYLLFDQSKGNKAHLVGDLTKSTYTKLSPDDTKLLLQFNRKSSLPLPLDNLVVIDLEKWEPIQLTNTTSETQLLNYEWPILSTKWMDDQTISVEIPNLDEITAETLIQWQESGSQTTHSIYTTEEN